MNNDSNPGESATPRLLVLFLISIVLMGIKSPDSLSQPQLWAEDGVIFFAQQYSHVLPQIFEPYAGYLHVIPRLVAWLAQAFSPKLAPEIYNVATLLISSFCVAYTSKRLDKIIPWPVVLLSFYLTPNGGEIFGTLTNLQWFIQFALVTACLIPASSNSPATTPSTILLIVLASLTGPFSVFVLIVLFVLYSTALAAHRIPLIRRIPLISAAMTATKELSSTRLAAISAGALIQIGYLLFSNSRTPHNSTLDSAHLIITTFGYVAPLHIFGQHYLTEKAWLIIFGLLVFAVVTRDDKEPQNRVSMLMLISLAAAFALAGTSANNLGEATSFGFSDRYFYFTKLVFWWALCFSMSSAKGKYQATMFTIGAMAFFSTVNSQYMQRPVFGDMKWREHADMLIQPGPHEIPINPSWTLKVTTERNEK